MALSDLEQFLVHNYPPQSAIILIIKYLFGGFSILYFLCVLIQLKLLTPFLLKHISRANNYKANGDWVWVVTPLYLLFFSIIRLNSEFEFQQVNAIVPFDNLFPAWLIYYYLGMVCKYKSIKIRPIYSFAALLVSLYLSIEVVFWLKGHSGIPNFPMTQSKITSMFIALSVILLLYSVREMDLPRNLFSRIGEMSFGIYILHIPIMLLLQKAIEMTHSTLIVHCWSFPVFKYMSVLLVTTCVLLLAYKMLPSKFVRLLGLK